MTARWLLFPQPAPYKFPASILQAIGKEVPEDEEELMNSLSALSGTEVPQRVKMVLNAPVRHYRVCEKDKALAEVHDILGL